MTYKSLGIEVREGATIDKSPWPEAGALQNRLLASAKEVEQVHSVK